MVSRDDDDNDIGQRLAQSLEIAMGVNDRAVRRPNLMEHVAAHQHHIRRELDGLVDRASERLRDVRLPLIDAARSQPLILAEAEMKVGEVNEAQGVSGEGEERRLLSR